MPLFMEFILPSEIYRCPLSDVSVTPAQHGSCSRLENMSARRSDRAADDGDDSFVGRRRSAVDGDVPLSGYEVFKAGRAHSHMVPVWMDEPPRFHSARVAASQISWRPAPQQRPASARLHAAPPRRPPQPPRPSAPISPRVGASPRVRHHGTSAVLNTDPAVPLSGIHHRLSPQILAEQLKSENEYHINNWLEARGKLPKHRTISKARRAALAGCYRLLDPSEAGGVEPADMQLILRAVGFPAHVIVGVIERAQVDENGLYPPHEFTRVCIEAEQCSRQHVAAFDSPRLASETFPIALAMERHRIHDVISEHIARLESTSGGAKAAAATAVPGELQPSPRMRGRQATTMRSPQETLRRVTQGLHPEQSRNRRHGGWGDVGSSRN